MNPLLMLKTQRVIYLSLLEDGNIIESIKTFEKYQNHLKTYVDADEKTQELILKEINSSRNIFIEKLNNIAKDYIKKGEYNKAAVCLSEVLMYWSKDIYSIINYIICLHNTDQFDVEEEFFDYLKTLIGENINPAILKDISKLCIKINKTQQAILFMKKYMDSIGSENIESEDYELLGSYYFTLYLDTNRDNLEYVLDSMDYLLKADEINPFSYSLTRQIALISSVLNNYQLGKIYWDKLFKIKYPTQDDLFEYSTFCLKTKNFKDFYEYYECRFTKEKKPLVSPFDTLNKPKWQGEDISDKTLLVLYEQGFGDTFLTYGYMSRLTKLAKKVIFIVQDPIYPLLKDNELNVEILQYTETDTKNLDFDYYIPAMSIMSALDLNESNISVGQGYIKANTDAVEIFKKKYFDNNKLKIGISNKGNLNGNKTRNIPIKEFLPLRNLDNIELYLLNKDVTEDEYKFCKNNAITVLKDDLKNFAITAAVIENCDLIVSSDNGVLNLAGAMGKRTFGIFNWHNEFRWFDLSGEDVVWYKSVKPFVNESMNDWQSSMTKVVEEIKQLQKL